MLKKTRILRLAVCIGLLLIGAGVLAQERSVVPDFSLESNQGEVVSLSDYAGEIVVLNFWATWCPYCRMEMDELQKLHDYLQGTKAAHLLLVNQIDGTRETRESGDQYLTEQGYDLVNLYDDYSIVGNYIFGVPGLPATVVIDREGRLVSAVLGPVDFETVLQMIGAVE